MPSSRTNSLQSAILDTFRVNSRDRVQAGLAKFRLRDWERLGTWLHASGLALYFLEELRRWCLSDVLPTPISEGLQQDHRNNRERTDALAVEFATINTTLTEAKLDFLNVKGFSLGRGYFSSPSLRSQFDLDFWLRRDQSEACISALSRLGYQVISATSNTLEFRAGGAAYPDFRDFYKPRSQRLVEIHLHDPQEMDRVPRASGLLGGFVFPTLSREQTFVQQALHLTKHLRHEWTRASWMLELRNAINSERSNDEFWRQVRTQSTSAGSAMSAAIAISATAAVFHDEIPPALGSWTVELLDPRIACWIEQFAERVVKSQFPGSKLYLLLDRELSGDSRSFDTQRRSVLLPVRIPGAMKSAQIGSGAWKAHVQYLRVRTLFHLREGFRFIRAEREWEKTARVGNVGKLGKQHASNSAVGV